MLRSRGRRRFPARAKGQGLVRHAYVGAPRGDSIGFSQINTQKAISKGLTFRSIGDTTKATLEWFHKPVGRETGKAKGGTDC